MMKGGSQLWEIVDKVEALIKNTSSYLKVHPRSMKELEEFMKIKFPKYSEFVSKGNREPYPRMVEINELRDSFILKKEVNKETCDRFAIIRHNLFGKKSTLEMVSLENSIKSPWQEGQLVLKGDHMSLL